MSYYSFNRQEILQKAKKTYWKEKAAEYYSQNKEVIKEKGKESLQDLVRGRKKTKSKSIKRRSIKNWFNIKKKY